MKMSTIVAKRTQGKSLLEQDQLYISMRDIAPALNRQLNMLAEAKGKALNPGDLHNIFMGVEQTLSAGGGNKTLIGKGADALGKVQAGIAKVGSALKDTTPVKGLDKLFRDAKQKVTAAMGKSETGAAVLRKIDHYQQLAKKYPNTQKAAWNAASVVTGLASGGAGAAALGAAKTMDGMIQGQELSTAVGGGLGAAGKAAAVAAGKAGIEAGVDAVRQGIDTVSNMDLNPFDNDNPAIDPNAPAVSDVYPDETVRGVKPGPDTPAPGPDNVTPPPKPVPPKPVPVKPAPAPAPAPAPDVTTGGGPATTGAEVPDVNSTAYLDAAKQNIISQNMAAQTAGTPGADILAQNTVTQPVAPRNIAEAFRALDFKVVALPLSIMVDKESTVRRWALNESLGRPRGRSVQLTNDGVNTVFYNVDKFYRTLEEARRNNYGRELRNQVGQAAGRTGRTGQQFTKDFPAAFKAMQTGSGRPAPQYGATNDANQQGGTVFNRPANANDPAAMAKNAPAANTRSDAGPQGKLPGGPAPAGNKIPYLAADPEGKFKTTYDGPVGNKFLDTVERGVTRAGNYMSDLFKQATTKFSAEQAKARFKDSGASSDSQAVAEFLVGQKVPADVITQVYKELGMPAPSLQSDTAGSGVNKNTMIKGLGGKPDVSQYYDASLDPDAQADAAKAGTAAGSAAGSAADAGTAGGAAGIAQQAGGGAQEKKVAREIDAEIDDLIRALRKTDNILQPAYVKYIRDALDKTFGPAEKAAPAAAPAEVPAASAAGTGGGLAPAPAVSAVPAAPAPAKAAESRRVKGRYIKETRAQKLARQFEAYVMGQG